MLRLDSKLSFCQNQQLQEVIAKALIEVVVVVLYKLQHFSLNCVLCRSISSLLKHDTRRKSFLSDHSDFVFLGQSISSWVSASFGVPQGSVLGPLLYLVYQRFSTFSD